MNDGLHTEGTRRMLRTLYVLALAILCIQGAAVWVLIERRSDSPSPAATASPPPFMIMQDGSLAYNGQLYRPAAPFDPAVAPRPENQWDPPAGIPVRLAAAAEQYRTESRTAAPSVAITPPSGPERRSPTPAPNPRPAAVRLTTAPAVPQALPAEDHARASVRHLVGYLEAGNYKLGAYQVRPSGTPYELTAATIPGWNQIRTTGKIAGYYYKDRILTSNRVDLKFEITSEEKDGVISIVKTSVRTD